MPPESLFLEALQGANFSFTARPEPVAGDLRMSWGIAVVLLSLLHSRGKKASFLKLQFLEPKLVESRSTLSCAANGRPAKFRSVWSPGLTGRSL